MVYAFDFLSECAWCLDYCVSKPQKGQPPGLCARQQPAKSVICFQTPQIPKRKQGTRLKCGLRSNKVAIMVPSPMTRVLIQYWLPAYSLDALIYLSSLGFVPWKVYHSVAHHWASHCHLQVSTAPPYSLADYSNIHFLWKEGCLWVWRFHLSTTSSCCNRIVQCGILCSLDG